MRLGMGCQSYLMLRASPFVADDFNFGSVSACIRLGLKYGIDSLVAHAVSFLKNNLPHAP